jgi:hypothetical protein
MKTNQKLLGLSAIIVAVAFLLSCGSNTQSTEVKTDSTVVAVDSTLSLTDTLAVDTAK